MPRLSIRASCSRPARCSTPSACWLSPVRPVTLNNGINYLPLPAFTLASGEWTAELVQDGKTADSLAVRLSATGDGWQVTQTQSLDVASGDTALSLPTDATDIRLRLDDSPQALFRSALDDLLSYPYGGVEQTASRLLPLSIAYPSLASNPQIRDRLRLIMQNSPGKRAYRRTTIVR